MSTTPTPSFVDLGVFAIIVLLLVPFLFFILFYYYLSQLAGINDSLKAIVDMLEDHWYPDKQNEKEEEKS